MNILKGGRVSSTGCFRSVPSGLLPGSCGHCGPPVVVCVVETWRRGLSGRCVRCGAVVRGAALRGRCCGGPRSWRVTRWCRTRVHRPGGAQVSRTPRVRRRGSRSGPRARPGAVPPGRSSGASAVPVGGQPSRGDPGQAPGLVPRGAGDGVLVDVEQAAVLDDRPAVRRGTAVTGAAAPKTSAVTGSAMEEWARLSSFHSTRSASLPGLQRADLGRRGRGPGRRRRCRGAAPGGRSARPPGGRRGG